MSWPADKDKDNLVDSSEAGSTDDSASNPPERPKEVGGRGGLDPTRYGDWEKAGRCIDF